MPDGVTIRSDEAHVLMTQSAVAHVRERTAGIEFELADGTVLMRCDASEEQGAEWALLRAVVFRKHETNEKNYGQANVRKED